MLASFIRRTGSRRGHFSGLLTRYLLGLVLTYLAAAYLLMPGLWTRYVRAHPALEDLPGFTYAGNGIPGDAINVSLTGTRDELMRTLLAAEWRPADPLSLRSSLKIAADSVLKREYADAPVSNLYLFGRKEDLAYEQPVGASPRQRHHVRFWCSRRQGADGRPVWVGAATFDVRVGLSHTTGQITHHTAPDIDTERDKLFRDLERTGNVEPVVIVRNYHRSHAGRNAGGDPWRTDGSLYSGVIRPAAAHPQ